MNLFLHKNNIFIPITLYYNNFRPYLHLLVLGHGNGVHLWLVVVIKYYDWAYLEQSKHFVCPIRRRFFLASII